MVPTLEFDIAEGRKPADRYEEPFPQDITLENIRTTDVVEMLLKDRGQLERLLRHEVYQRDLMPKLMAIALFGFFVYGIVATAILNAFRVQNGFWFPHVPAAHWNELSIGNLSLSYTLGLIAANGICLPSFYFYGLLAGIRITMLGVTAHAIKGMAAGAVALVGLLPLYVTVALTALVFPGIFGSAAWWTLVGLVLPFIAGIWGAVNVYQGFVGLADTISPQCRYSRECFLRRLIFMWVGCSAFVTPVVIYSLWDLLSDWTHVIGLAV
jgi:hypothetical protein